MSARLQHNSDIQHSVSMAQIMTTGAIKLKIQDMKLADHCVGQKIGRHENATHTIAMHKSAELKIQ